MAKPLLKALSNLPRKLLLQGRQSDREILKSFQEIFFAVSTEWQIYSVELRCYELVLITALLPGDRLCVCKNVIQSKERGKVDSGIMVSSAMKSDSDVL